MALKPISPRARPVACNTSSRAHIYAASAVQLHGQVLALDLLVHWQFTAVRPCEESKLDRHQG